MKTFGVEKMHQILTEIDKNTKIQILKILCSFCVILENLRGLEFQRRSTRNKLVVRKAFFEIIEFLNGKNSQFATKNYNNFKMYHFHVFMQLLSNF